MNDYDDHRARVRRGLAASRRFESLIRLLIGGRVRVATQEEDYAGVDFVKTHNGIEFGIAARVRGSEFAKKKAWAQQITFSARHENGPAGEWQKIVEFGSAQQFFYGFDASTEDGVVIAIHPWFLVDLTVCRKWLLWNKPDRPTGYNQSPKGFRSPFYAFDVPELLRVFGSKVLIDAEWSGVGYETPTNEELGESERELQCSGLPHSCRKWYRVNEHTFALNRSAQTGRQTFCKMCDHRRGHDDPFAGCPDCPDLTAWEIPSDQLPLFGGEATV